MNWNIIILLAEEAKQQEIQKNKQIASLEAVLQTQAQAIKELRQQIEDERKILE